MSVHDIYVIAPYIGMAGAGILVILLDMAIRRKGILPAVAFMGLLVPFAFSLLQAFDLGNQLDLVRGSGPLDTGEAQHFSGKPLAGPVCPVLQLPGPSRHRSDCAVLRRLRPPDGAFPGGVLRADPAVGHRDDAAGRGHRAGHDLHLAGAGDNAAGGPGRIHDDPSVQRGRDEVPDHRGHQFGGNALRDGDDIRLHRQHSAVGDSRPEWRAPRGIFPSAICCC